MLIGEWLKNSVYKDEVNKVILTMFSDRRDAGKQLARKLEIYRGLDNLVVYALPRGGVVVADEVAKFLKSPLSLIVSRKVVHPFSEEFAICAVSESGQRVCNEEFTAPLDQEWLEIATEEERKEAKRRREEYTPFAQEISSRDKTAIIVDDGVATGLTMEVAIKEIQKQKPEKIVVAVPVSPSDTTDRIKDVHKIKDFVAVLVDDSYKGSVGAYYDRFSQISDEEVVEIMSDYSSTDDND